MLAGPRLRQVALVASDCDTTVRALQQAFGWPQPFRDPGVRRFGLVNAVFTAGDTFIEVVTPAQPGTTAGRYLARRGGDSGYMAIFQMPDLAAARRRVAAAGVRVVWTADLPDIAGTHLHPKDVPGAIVSLDWADPPGSWRWAGPEWTGHVPAHRPGGIRGVTIEVTDPVQAGERWAAVLGLAVTRQAEAAVVGLTQAGQDLRFVPAHGPGEGITEVRLTTKDARPPVSVAGVRFVSVARLPGSSAAGSTGGTSMLPG